LADAGHRRLEVTHALQQRGQQIGDGLALDGDSQHIKLLQLLRAVVSNGNG